VQIDQMVRFIKQEAQEKANEIGVSAEEVCWMSCFVSNACGVLPCCKAEHV